MHAYTHVYIYKSYIVDRKRTPSIWNSANLPIRTEMYCYFTIGGDGIGIRIGEHLETITGRICFLFFITKRYGCPRCSC